VVSRVLGLDTLPTECCATVGHATLPLCVHQQYSSSQITDVTVTNVSFRALTSFHFPTCHMLHWMEWLVIIAPILRVVYTCLRRQVFVFPPVLSLTCPKFANIVLYIYGYRYNNRICGVIRIWCIDCCLGKDNTNWYSVLHYIKYLNYWLFIQKNTYQWK
jgi:hypothetical protein